MQQLLTTASGAMFGLSLLIAIGAQNAFVLRQGLLRQHVLAVITICAVSDALLIAVGVGGVALLAAAAPSALMVLRIGGIAFLLGYAAMAARRAWQGSSFGLHEQHTQQTLAKTVTTCVAFTWLNPHVYLDTVVLLGSVANAHHAYRQWFGVGAMLASAVWFVSLGYGARLLRRLFEKPRPWRVLDTAIALTMAATAARLALSA